jgi:CRP-like cAMP-binding protein
MRSPTQHSLLNQLPMEVDALLRPVLRRVTLTPGQVLFEAGQVVSWVYFPITAQVDELWPSSQGSTLVLRQVDAQAMAGSCVMGDALASRTARVSQAGEAYRMAYGDFVQALDQVPAFRELVLQDAARALLAVAPLPPLVE